MTTHEKQKLLTFSSGGWVLLVAGILTLLSALLVLYPVYQTGFHSSIGDGRNPDTYGFDLSKLTIPREQLLGSGYAKDEIHAVPEKLVETVSPPEVDLIAANEHIRFLVPDDLVIGVVAGGMARAYPVRILNIHEVVNDKLGDVPVAVTWSPLCGAAVVFNRRLDGPGTTPLEIGVSGLLYQSDLIFFDRRSDTKNESLWPQLALHAVAGPAVGKDLPVLPSETVTWKQWRSEHPGTRVFLGLRTLKEQYGDAQDPINMYFRDDELKFPVSPLWSDPKLPRKTMVDITSDDLKHFKVALAGGSGAASTSASTAASQPASYRLSAFVFAWYAQHRDDTDYSALK